MTATNSDFVNIDFASKFATVDRMAVDIVKGKGHRWHTSVLQQSLSLIAMHGDAKRAALFSLISYELAERA